MEGKQEPRRFLALQWGIQEGERYSSRDGLGFLDILAVEFLPCIQHPVLIILVQDCLTADSCFLNSKMERKMNGISQTSRSYQEEMSR